MGGTARPLLEWKPDGRRPEMRRWFGEFHSIPSLKQKTSQIAENEHPSCNDGSNAAPITTATVKKCSSGALNSHLEIEDPFVSMKTSGQCGMNDKNGLKVARQSQNHQLKSDGECSFEYFLTLQD